MVNRSNTSHSLPEWFFLLNYLYMYERLRDNDKTDWEAILAAEGLGSQLPPDKAVEALQESAHLESETDSDTQATIHAIRDYYLHRGFSYWGEHKQVAQEIESQLGLEPGTVDESLINLVADEIKDAQIALQNIRNAYLEKHPHAAFREAALKRYLLNQAAAELPHLSQEERETLVDRLDYRPAWKLN